MCLAAEKEEGKESGDFSFFLPFSFLVVVFRFFFLLKN
jgi:hypothetical protein